MFNADRFRALLTAKGLSQSELARRVGVSQSAIHKLASGSGYGSTHLHKIARELGTSPEYLQGETDDPRAGAILLPTAEIMAEQLDLVPLAEVDMSYGMGGAFTEDAPVVTIHQFPREWVATISPAPSSSLFIARGRGTSMEPTMRDGDMLVIDRSMRQIRDQDDLWAITIGDIGMVKRLRVRGEKVTLLSDNPLVPEDFAHPDEINVVGKVVFVGRRM